MISKSDQVDWNQRELEHTLANAMNLLFDIQWAGRDLGDWCCPSCEAYPKPHPTVKDFVEASRNHHPSCKLFAMVYQ